MSEAYSTLSNPKKRYLYDLELLLKKYSFLNDSFQFQFNDKELKVFLESLNTKQFTDIQNFFETMPKLQHIVEVENPKTKVMNTITLEGMQSFFE